MLMTKSDLDLFYTNTKSDPKLSGVWWLCINTSFLVMFMSLLWYLESQLLVTHGEIKLKQEQELEKKLVER